MKIVKYKYFYLLGALVALLILIEAMTPKAISWKVSLAPKDKNPFGGYVLSQQLPAAFPGQEVSHSTLPAMEEQLENVNLLVLAERLWPDSLDAVSMLKQAEAGSTILLAASTMGGVLADTLRVKLDDMQFKKISEMTLDLVQDSIGLHFTNPGLSPQHTYYYFEKSTAYAYFNKWDTASATVLAVNAYKHPVLMSMPWGKGRFILSSTPLVFSNYHLLKSNRKTFAEGILSYLPDKDLLWTSYYQLGRQEAATPLRYVLSQPSLKWAYYITMIGLLMFVVFEGKRRQRPIPVVKPLPNDTLQFTETIGVLYMQQGDHRDLAEKKIIYFLEHVRSEWHMPTEKLDEAFCASLAAKSGNKLEGIKELIRQILHIRKKSAISADELLQLNKRIEDFYNKR